MRSFRLARFVVFLALLTGLASVTAASPVHLQARDPFYPNRHLARLTTPQWIGESGVKAVVILSIDDMRTPENYERYLRPILERLKKIDGRAPVSIFCNSLQPTNAHYQTWLREGLSLEVHTLTHLCPLLSSNGLVAAMETVHGSVDQLHLIPNNVPIAFRMPCCDSMNSASPRFFTEILNRPTPQKRFLKADSSVMNLTTTNDGTIPRQLLVDANGVERFRKYFPQTATGAVKKAFQRFAGFIEDYPYPYVIGDVGWEFPCAVPSDWEAFNLHGPTNAMTTRDWIAALDATVAKEGVMTMVLHPHGWSSPEQIIELIDYSERTYGKAVKFLNMGEAVSRLEKNLLLSHPLRSSSGNENGARLLDLNRDGYMDVVVGNETIRTTLVWNASHQTWIRSSTPTILNPSTVAFGAMRSNVVLFDLSSKAAAWIYAGDRWQAADQLSAGLETLDVSDPTNRTVFLRDFNNDGTSELIIAWSGKDLLLGWSETNRAWKKLPYAFPAQISTFDAKGGDTGLRFVDLNDDGFDDLFLSNEERIEMHLWATSVEDRLGWKAGWSHAVRSGKRTENPADPPPFVKQGQNNGAWFHSRHLVVQNEETAALPDVVYRRSFKELIAFETPAPKTPADALKSFQVRPGFKVELVAAEPVVIDPIAFDWDAEGNFWVVEMRDYPVGIDGSGKPGGVIKRLQDKNGDGRYDSYTTFLENVRRPTGVFPWRKGLLIASAPDIIYAEDRNSDGKADHQQILFSGFEPGNEQHLFNGFELGLDGWVYGANGDSGGKVTSRRTGKTVDISGRDFRFKPDTGEFETVSVQTQFARRRNDWGDWFGNNNPTWLWHVTFPEHYLRRNPKLAIKSVRQLLANYPESTRVFPISKQPERWNEPWSLNHVTSACSPTPYRDNLFGEEFRESVFIADPVHNVVHREVLQRNGATFTSRRAAEEQDREFLASSDVWFRPTMLKVGPDGALYIADMYRFVLEHPEWISPEAQSRIDLRAGADKGRIYRVVPQEGVRRNIPNLAPLKTRELARSMNSSSGWQRDTVQRLLQERNAKGADLQPLRKLALGAVDARVRVQALAALMAMDAAPAELLERALRDEHPEVRVQVLRAESGSAKLFRAAVKLVHDPEPRVRFQLALHLGYYPVEQARPILLQLLEKNGTDPLMHTAILSSLPPDDELVSQWAAQQKGKSQANKLAKSAVPPVLPKSGSDNLATVQAALEKLQGNSNRGREVFQNYCASCHRLRGSGTDLGPDLDMVKDKPNEWLLTAIFDPNQAVEARYQGTMVETTSGEQITGIITSETANNITIKQAGGVEQAVLANEIRSRNPSARSLMPEGFNGLLSAQELADLIAWLRLR